MNSVARKAPPDLSPVKRAQILAGAREAFAELGYERASVDLVAARAGVSKATVYNHFHDKKALFVACLSEEADAMRQAVWDSVDEPPEDVAEALRRVGEKLVRFTTSAAVVALYRHTLAEVGRFPDIGRTLFERGPAVVYDMTARHLQRWVDKGVLRIDDVRAAAVQFVMMSQGDLVLRAQLGVAAPADAVRDTVARAVLAFLTAYGA